MISTTLLAGTMLVPSLLLACPPLPEDRISEKEYLVQQQRVWAMIARTDDSNDPSDDGSIAGGGDPSTVGAWLPPQPWDVISIHAALLPNGKVLQYSYPDGGPLSRARLYNPVDGSFEAVDLDSDIFCSGLSQMADGRLFVSGGNRYDCDFQGRTDTHIFNPATGQWTYIEPMDNGRWYPTNVALPDGRTLIFSGLSLDCETNPTMEVFSPETGVNPDPSGHRFLALFPRMHILSDGRVAHVGPEQSTFMFDPDGAGWQFVANSNFSWRGQGTSVLIPGRTDQVMILGGDSPVTNTAEIFDFQDEKAAWRYTNPMHHARAHANAVILPNKEVFVIGGGQDGLYGAPVLTPEMFDPVTETWTELPAHQYGRMYHSTAVLLPDGRVLCSGQDNGASAYIGEIYQPSYLFRGARPLLADAPESVVYGQTFAFTSPQADTIDSVVFIKLSAMTHSVNFEQRLLEIPFTTTGGDGLEGTAPATANLAPPGYYMMFALTNGVPSKARMIRMGQPAPADFNGDGVVNAADLAALLDNWGTCGDAGNCPWDLNGDGTVGPGDLAQLLDSWS